MQTGIIHRGKLVQSCRNLPDFLPGRFVIELGSARDYHDLAKFHYCAGRPATWARILAVRFESARREVRSPAVAVAVLSFPTPSCRARERYFRLTGCARDKLLFINTHLRTISRVIVHPQFRSVGLSSILVEQLCRESSTRYVEALARMGSVHPMFERAGMTRVGPLIPGDPAYYVFDREASDTRRCA
jgi:GNAT superfamily N-acetyltransferase